MRAALRVEAMGTPARQYDSAPREWNRDFARFRAIGPPLGVAACTRSCSLCAPSLPRRCVLALLARACRRPWRRPGPVPNYMPMTTPAAPAADPPLQPTPGTHASPADVRRVIFASSLGTVFEWYDFYLYGSLAVFFGGLFFPGGNPTAALLA